jgi:hypothetical protein
MPSTPPDDGFKLNEPEPRIPGGRERKSVRVARDRVPDAERRERLNELLLAHDPEVVEEQRAKLTDDDVALLRQVAAEGALSGTPPALRQNAIAMLARWPTGENLDLLSHLARRGDDLYVRGAALVALGQTGLRLVAPTLGDGLTARDPIEVAVAERAVVALGRSLGEPGLHAAFEGERRKVVREGLERAFKRLAAEDAGGKPKKQRATTDRGPASGRRRR